MPYKMPAEKIQSKEEIISLAKEYLHEKHASWLDINGFVWNDMQYPEAPTTFCLDIAARIIRTGGYKMEVQEGTGRYVVFALERKWGERNPLLNQIRISVITAIFSLLVGVILYQLSIPKQVRLDDQQNERIQQLSDSLSNFDKDIKEVKDSLKIK